MGDYLVHIVGGGPEEPKELNEFLGTKTLAHIMTDLTTTEEQQEAVDEAIDGAEAFLNSYLSSRYDVPVASPTKALKNATGSISVCNLYNRGRGAPQNVQDRCDMWKAWVKDVAMSKAHLIDAEPQPDPPEGGSVSQVEANTREMTRDKLNWW